MSENADSGNLPPPPSYEESQKYEVHSGGVGTKTEPYPAGQMPYQPPQGTQQVGGSAAPYPMSPGYVPPNQPSPYYQAGQAQPYPTQPYGQNMNYPMAYAGSPQGHYPQAQGGMAPQTGAMTQGQTYPVAYGTAAYGPGTAAFQNAQKKRLVVFFVIAGIMIMVFIIIVTTVSSIH